MKLEDVYFWQSWPVGRRKQYFRLLLLLWVAVWAFVFTLSTYLTNDARKEVESARARYHRVLPLAQETLGMQQRVGNLADMTPMAAAQQVSRNLKLENKLASLRPTQLAGGKEGVQLQFEALNLEEYLNLLTTLKEKGQLKILSMVFNHRQDKPDLADLQLVLSR